MSFKRCSSKFSIKGIFGIVAWKQTTFDFAGKAPNVAGEAYLRLYNDQWRTSGDMRIWCSYTITVFQDL